jgi:hypothetical protein
MQSKQLKIVNWENDDYGMVGTPTKMYTQDGERLYVGDVVTIKSVSGSHTAKDKLVVESDGRLFIMGISICCNKNGVIDEWTVEMQKRYAEIKDGEKYDDLRVVEQNMAVNAISNEDLVTEIARRIDDITNKPLRGYSIVELLREIESRLTN